MNIEFKETLFRFIYPAALFWTLFFVFYKDNFPTLRDFLFSQDSFSITLIMIFIASGIIINAIGSVLMIFPIKLRLEVLDSPRLEVNYWEAISKADSNLIERKIDRRWDFVTAHLNSSVVILIWLFFHIYTYLTNETIKNELSAFISVLVLLLIFGILFFRGLKYIKYYTNKFK